MRIAVFMSWPQPFHMPIFAELQSQCDVKIDYYCLVDDRDRGWGETDHLFPVHRRYRVRGLGGMEWAGMPWDLFSAVRRGTYDCVIIGGWERPQHIMLHELCATRNVPVIVGSDRRGGPGGRAERPLHPSKAFLRERIVGRILRRASAALGSGEAARRHFEDVGFKGFLDKRFFGVDCERFRPAGTRSPGGTLSILYAGRLVLRKRVGDLVAAVGRLHAEGVSCDLTIAGDGPCRSKLQSQAHSLGIAGQVHFLGACNHDRLPGLMQDADVFALPSEAEPWGVVMLEAAAAGLAIVGTDEVGAAVDVVEEDVNGMVYPVGDVRHLVASLRKLHAWRGSEQWSRVQKTSRSRGEDFSFQRCAQTYWEALQYAVQ